MWVLFMVVAIGVILLALAAYVFVTNRKARKFNKWDTAMAWGALVGAFIGIGLVEFGGYEYPLPFILLLLGSAAGQVIGFLVKHRKKQAK